MASSRVMVTVIRGGLVLDGQGGPGRQLDVRIGGDRILEVGPDLDPDGGRVVDADGLVVAPGFVDVHVHYDAQVLWDPLLTPSVLHGVTSMVGGNCGFTIADAGPEHAEYLVRLLAGWKAYHWKRWRRQSTGPGRTPPASAAVSAAWDRTLAFWPGTPRSGAR